MKEIAIQLRQIADQLENDEVGPSEIDAICEELDMIVTILPTYGSKEVSQ